MGPELREHKNVEVAPRPSVNARVGRHSLRKKTNLRHKRVRRRLRGRGLRCWQKMRSLVSSKKTTWMFVYRGRRRMGSRRASHGSKKEGDWTK